MKLLLAISALAAVALAQEQCSSACAPQPVTIQLSCNSNSQRPSHPPPPPNHPPPHHGHPPGGHYTSTPGPAPPAGHEEYYPAPAPAPASPPEHYAPAPAGPPSSEEFNIKDDPDRGSCMWRNNGAGTFFLDGDTTNNFYLSDWFGQSSWAEPDPYDRIRWWRDDAPKPPRDWDGSAETLGFPMPEKGTELYKLLLCWPLLTPSNREQVTPTDVNIFNDPDITKCNWIWNSQGFGEQFGNVPGGFPSDYRLHRGDPPHVTTVETPYMDNHPPLDWDGNPETLGYPMPQKGSHDYNVLLCFPYDFGFGQPMDYTYVVGR